ncbi:O-antigen ligase family protein [Microbacterium sp. 1P10UB]|uniref:O-antigen ligase family protein n=1 Tax=unclassified Microbacterium TaxID=2609290 RepID=UPI0039A0686F
MAVHTKHPVSPLPAAPVREKTRHLLLRGWCIFLLFQAVAGPAMVHALGAAGAAALLAAGGIVSAVLWLNIRPTVQWRRLPWYAMGYILFAGLSILWSAWPMTSALTWALLVITSMQAFFVAAVLTWREVIRAIASAFKWAIGLSLVFEVAVALIVRGPLLPGFVLPTEPVDPALHWSSGALFGGGRLQGIWGSSNLLAAAALMAVIVFAIRYSNGAPRRVLLIGWMLLSAFLFVRASSATAALAAVGVVIVLTTVLLMRTASRPGQRTKYYVGYAVIGVGGLIALWLWRGPVFGALDRAEDLDAREGIWQTVLARAGERPAAGWGFATPWLPWDPAFDGWIVTHGRTVIQAHDMWIDVYFQLGVIGIVLMGLTYLAFVWRSWFFAVDRPRWDLRADRPYSPLTLLPTLLGAVLIVQGLSESAPLMVWGWMLLLLFAFKIKQSPLIGVGPAEQTLAMELGDPVEPVVKPG